MSNKEFFSYLQLRDFLRVKAKTFPKLPDLTFVEQLCYSDKPLYKTISRIYEALISNQPLDDPDKSRKRWEQDLGVRIDADLWGQLCKDGVTSTLNSRYRLIQFNFLHQLYYTPSRLHTFNNSISPLCFRCGTEEGTFLHSTWLCPKVKVFWEQVCDSISQIHGIDFPMDPEVCLLGNFTNSNLRNRQAIKLTEMLLIIAKKCIALKWKADTDVPIGLWLSEICSCVPLEKITYSMRSRGELFYKIWKPFLNYINIVPHDLI